ncbi:DUF4833 domain-containing protein [Pedobacter psychrodurus]|uniref:DUF4833 domain-containing protein n=1 Tax=Pedobacter psychrodurus TaxID=2530456 RepID=A0A4R0PMU8_9SPHI|nr:DUF4833 domain-containing protein [Pedobacter psychrodurus]TCD20358.1 DUF4833 domain-containing protein [Pedobacter psychrodurus]
MQRTPPNLSKNLFIAIFIFLFSSGQMWAQSKDPSPINFPTPKNVDHMLFYLQRDPNTNTLIYALNLKENGSINTDAPIQVYWIRYGEKGQKKDLGYIQRKFAYGIDTKALGADKYEFRFVSHKKLPFYLQRYSDKSYHVSVTINNRIIRVTRLFIRIQGGSFWLPNVKYGEIEGIEESTGKAIVERISVK